MYDKNRLHQKCASATAYQGKSMSTTQLFVELLVIGLGAAIWISLLADVIAGGQIRFSELWSDKALLLPIIAVAYALGVVVDRLVWSIFAPLERRIEEKYLRPSGVPRWYVERLVANGDGTLAREIYYNRSRLRICRAWVLNGALLTLSLVLWGELRHKFSHPQSFAVGLAGAAFAVCSFWALCQFMRDYYRNLSHSHEFLGPGHYQLPVSTPLDSGPNGTKEDAAAQKSSRRPE